MRATSVPAMSLQGARSRTATGADQVPSQRWFSKTSWRGWAVAVVAVAGVVGIEDEGPATVLAPLRLVGDLVNMMGERRKRLNQGIARERLRK